MIRPPATLHVKARLNGAGAMKACQMVRVQQEPELREVEVPEPGPGRVLVRIAGAAAYHSDLHVMERPPEAVPGRSALHARPRERRPGGGARR